jgi:predicted RNase H-like nuclease (RuvC/YqgF family)
MSTEDTTTDSNGAQSTTIQTLAKELRALRTKVDSLETENKVLERRVETQSDRIEELEDRIDKNDQVRTDLAQNANEATSVAEETKEIACSVSAKVSQIEASNEGESVEAT